jgi:DNA-binding response OmpR family regulator
MPSIPHMMGSRGDLAQINDYDVVILDVMMPKADGLAVCRDLRRAGREVPILMLTTKDAVPDRVAGLDSGADDYLPKPFAFDELLARVRAVSRRWAPTRAPRLSAGDLVLDTVSRRVS